MKYFFNRNNVMELTLSALFMATMVFPSIIYAQATPVSTTTSKEYTLLEPLPCIPGPGSDCPAGDLTLTPKVDVNTYIIYAFNLFIAIAAVAAVFMIVWGGFLYMTSASVPIKSNGIKKVQDAIIGLLMVLCTFIIMRTVNPKLVEIPPNLVPAIDICKEGASSTNDTCLRLDSAANFFNGLKADALKYKALTADTQLSITDKQNANNVLEKKKTELLTQLSALTGMDPSTGVDAMCANTIVAAVEPCLALRKINIDQAALISSGSYLVAQKRIQGKMTDVLSNPTLATDTFVIDLATAYEEEKAKLVRLNATPKELQDFQDLGYSAVGRARLLNSVDKLGGDIQIQAVVEKIIPAISDPVVQADLKKEIIKTIDVVVATTYKSDPAAKATLARYKADMLK